MSDICDRCKKVVISSESVTELHAIIQENPLLPFTINKCRHIRCSPSTAQWIVHPDFKPVIDQRPKYDKTQYSAKKQEIFEKKFTDAWLKLTKPDKELEESTVDIMNLDP